MNNLRFKLIRQVFICFLLSISFLSFSQPEQIHLSLNGQNDSGKFTSMLVTWCSDSINDLQFVKYGTTSDLGSIVKVGSKKFHETAIFSAAIRNLKPGTKYYYRCGSENAGWSPVYSFVSEPAHGRSSTFRVGIIGDTQNNIGNEDFQKSYGIFQQIISFSPDLILHMGDIVENGSILTNWTQFLKVSQELNASAPLMPVLGNHDIENKIGNDFQKPFADFYDLFNLPGDEVNYSFNYGNVHFVALFAGYAQAAAEVGLVKYEKNSPEYRWLDNDLLKAGKDKKTDWIVVYMHYPVYSYEWSNISKWREAILPLLEKHSVDLCLAGHRHVYERHLQINRGIPIQNDTLRELRSERGTVFITNGTGGGTPQGTGGVELPTMAFTPGTKMYNFAIMTVNNKSIDYEVYDQDGTKIDRFILRK